MNTLYTPQEAFQGAFDGCLMSATEADEAHGVAIGNTYRRAASIVFMEANAAGFRLDAEPSDFEVLPEWCFEYTHATQETDHGTCMTCCQHPDHDRQ